MKELHELTKSEVKMLRDSGMLWEFYPEATGNEGITEINHDYYPKDANQDNPFERPMFGIEYNTRTYKIVQQNIIMNEADYNKYDTGDAFDNLCKFGSVEGHPLTLMEGKVQKTGIISMETKAFLEYLVDALNEKVVNDKLNNIHNDWVDNIEKGLGSCTEIIPKFRS